MTRRRLLPATLLVALLLAAAPAKGNAELPAAWQAVLADSALPADPGARVVAISERFLGTPYVADTLGGGPGQAERLTIRLDAVDCFTLLDYVEALRRSGSAAAFPDRLREVRYRDGVVAWEQRRHFFTDWAAAPEQRIADVTAEIGGQATRQAAKALNRRADGTLHLPGVPVQTRTVRYLPAAHLAAALDRLRSGDYVGLYTPAAGLDVTHVGLVVRRDGRLWLRHASSHRDAGRVVDSDLAAYLAGKPGLVVLRPR